MRWWVLAHERQKDWISKCATTAASELRFLWQPELNKLLVMRRHARTQWHLPDRFQLLRQGELLVPVFQ